MKWLMEQIKFFTILLIINLIGIVIVGLVVRVNSIEGFGKMLPLAGFFDYILAYFCLKGNYLIKGNQTLHLVAQSLSLNKQKVVDENLSVNDKSFRMFIDLVIIGSLFIVVAGVLKVKI